MAIRLHFPPASQVRELLQSSKSWHGPFERLKFGSKSLSVCVTLTAIFSQGSPPARVPIGNQSNNYGALLPDGRIARVLYLASRSARWRPGGIGKPTGPQIPGDTRADRICVVAAVSGGKGASPSNRVVWMAADPSACRMSPNTVAVDQGGPFAALGYVDLSPRLPTEMSLNFGVADGDWEEEATVTFDKSGLARVSSRKIVVPSGAKNYQLTTSGSGTRPGYPTNTKMTLACLTKRPIAVSTNRLKTLSIVPRKAGVSIRVSVRAFHGIPQNQVEVLATSKGKPLKPLTAKHESNPSFVADTLSFLGDNGPSERLVIRTRKVELARFEGLHLRPAQF